LDNASEQKVWAYRKASWAVEDLEQEIGLVYRLLGLKGLQSIPGIEPVTAAEIEHMILEHQKATPGNAFNPGMA
jgi:DNA polymerase/3'-5' exonuclease PolX